MKTPDPNELLPDDVTVSREVLQGVRESTKQARLSVNGVFNTDCKQYLDKALASLDAVLSEGK